MSYPPCHLHKNSLSKYCSNKHSYMDFLNTLQTFIASLVTALLHVHTGKSKRTG